MADPLPTLTSSLHRAPPAVVVELAGELDLCTGPIALAALHTAMSLSDDVVVDLAQVAFLDASGVRLLRSAQRELGHRGGSFALRRPSPAVRRVLALVGASLPVR